MRQSTSRRQRRDRRASSGPAVAAPAYITRNIPYYEFLDEEALVRIEQQADWLLEENGIEFRDDPKALEIWKSAGADVQGTRVRLPNGMARELLKTAPSEFTQHARNPARSVKIGGKNTVFAPVYGPPFVRCLDQGRRYGTLDDLKNLVKLTYMLPSLHHSGHVTCEPCDTPVNKRHMDMLLAHFTLSDKPVLGAITEQSRA
ncbi:MAG: trimethylamine methyltransferase family protein, partial [Pseudomonadota bacterium]